jgi:hypothetical protein
MAAGDVTLTLAIADGTTKTVTLASAVRVKAKGNLVIADDAEWAVTEINKFGNVILAQANAQVDVENPVTYLVFANAT